MGWKEMKLTEHQKLKMSEYGIPNYMHDAIIGYYENGWQPGGFLTELINNDLKEAIGRADDTNVHCLKAYVMWFYNQAPIGTWGHSTAVSDYLKEFSKQAA